MTTSATLGEETPWPTNHGDDDDDVLFVVDASSATGRSLLENWIESARPSPVGGDATSVTVDIGANQPPDAAALRTIEAQAGSTIVVPVRIVWSTGTSLRHAGPRVRDLLLGDPRNPRPLMAKVIVRRHPERARPIAAAPASIAELRSRYAETYPDADDTAIEGFGEFVVRLAGIALDVSERRLEGRRYKVPRSVMAGVQSNPSYKSALGALAADTGSSISELGSEAETYLREMLATPTTFFVDWTGKITRWIVSLGYGDIVTDKRAVERAREHVSNNPSALLWTHKSHLDGIALLSVLYDNDFPSPHQMGGINMAFRGLAGVSRRAGVIFIRRSFSDNPLYKVTLQQYLGYLLDKRFPFSWAFEGTRSRTGKLMPPRYGLLKYIVEAAHATRSDDLHIIPVAISYDLIGEASDYGRLEAGQSKQAENFGWFMSYLKRLRTPSGQMYVDFGEPVVIPWKFEPPQQSDLEPVAFEVARRVNAMVPVTLPALMFTALLGAAPRAMTHTELDVEMRALRDWLNERGIRMASSFDDDDSEQLTAMAEIIFERGIVKRHTQGTDTVFRIGDGQQAVASYHRNTIVHYFVDRAMTELALLHVVDLDPGERADAFWSELFSIRDLLKFEFFHTPSDRFKAEVRAALDAHEPTWEAVLGGTPDDVRALVASMTPLVAHATIRQILEAYWIVADRFARLDGSETLEEAACVKAALGAGEQAFLRQRISSRASIGKQMFKNAYQMLDSKGLVEVGGDDLMARRQELAGDLDARIRCLSELRDLALSPSVDSAPTPVSPTA